jgi:uncharacterized membrane protein
MLAPREETAAAPQPSRVMLLARDRAAQILFALALLGNLALFAYLSARFDALPDPLPLHFDAAGLADRIEAKSGIFGLPIIGALVLGVNSALGLLAHRRERAATLFLLMGALIVQILLWLAVNSIIGGLL